MNLAEQIPLEDELGDVLEKALRRSGMSEEGLALKTGISASRIRDAIDYRPDLSSEELQRVSKELGLNEVGLCALGAGSYPVPEFSGLPFCVWPLRMRFGIGVVNAYLVGDCGSSSALLFDTGSGIEGLDQAWPKQIRSVEGVFVTHVEPEHAGGLCDIVKRFDVEEAYIPAGARARCGRAIHEGEVVTLGRFEVKAYLTPGHCSAHACYQVRRRGAADGRSLLVAGDLVFAGSAGGAYFSHEELQAQMRRVLSSVPPDTVLAPGHGPMTTAGNELRFNPFLG